MDMDSPVTPCVPKSLVVNADHLAVPYHGNRLLSLPGSVACYCYFVYRGIFQGRKEVATRYLQWIPLPLPKHSWRERTIIYKSNNGERLKSRRLLCMNCHELSLSRGNIGIREKKGNRGAGSNEERRERESNYVENEREKEGE